MASFIGNDIKFKVMEIENVSIDIDSIEDLKKIKSSNKRSKTIDYIKETNL